ncbi:type II toxin-antitoxin system RelB family antitoxin [Proteiniclasticum sp. C24MP]|uniref:type II toxin-antitoxin system RelB family antitoxin n=1 Tax=Proteiniclasticum sp. C24MP TaxID=3374101 RepID=UPI0037550B24
MKEAVSQQRMLFVLQCKTKGGVSMSISLRLNNEEDALFRKYAAMKKMSVSEMIRETVLEKIEDEYDLEAYDLAVEEYRKNPVTYTHREIIEQLENE